MFFCRFNLSFEVSFEENCSYWNGSLCSSVSIEIKYNGDEDHWKYKKGMKMGKEI